MSTYKYDFLIVGAGLFGSVFARELTDAGAKCFVIDKRSHIGGNCYTKSNKGIHVHKYGPHIFHTNSDEVWQYMNKWCEFNSYINSPKVLYKDKLYSFPINLMTLNQLWGVKTPEEAERKLKEVRISIEKPCNLEEWILSQVGEEIYNTFVYGYTKKQWGRDPKDLPSSIIRRLPIRLTYNDNYYNDKYQGIPIGGYTQIFEKLLYNIPKATNTDYLSNRNNFDSLAKKVVYTGPLDEFFDYSLGVLEWRSLRFEQEALQGDYQGNAIVNYTEYDIPYTRVIEHKHFEQIQSDHTIITREYPQKWDKSKDKYYPINDEANNDLCQRYKKLIDTRKYIFGGRLADYKYYDMHQVVGSALHTCQSHK